MSCLQPLKSGTAAAKAPLLTGSMPCVSKMRFVDAFRRFWKKFLANLKTNRAPLDLFGTSQRRSK